MTLSVKENNQNLTSTSEKTFEEIYSKADILYLVLNPEGYILSGNVTIQEKLDYDHKALVGKNFLDLIPEIEHKIANKVLKKCLSRGYVRGVTLQLINSETRSFSCHINGLLVSDENGNPQKIRLFIKDIHYQTKLERQQIITQTILPIAQKTDLKEEDISAVLTSILNGMVCDWVGLNIIDKTGKYYQLQTGILDDDLSNDKEHFQCWKPEQWAQFVNKNKDDKEVHFENTGTFWTTSLSSLILEVEKTEDKNLLASLIEYESLLLIPVSNEWVKGYLILIHHNEGQWDNSDSAFLEPIGSLLGGTFRQETSQTTNFDWKDQSWMDVPDTGVFIIEKGVILYTNQWVEKTLGWNKSEMIGMEVTSLASLESQEIFQKLLDSELTNQVINVVDSMLWTTNSGHMVKLACSVAQIDFQGHFVHIWYLTANEEYPLLDEQLIQTRRMELLGMLVGGIVHDFNNLLATILGYSSLLKEEVKENSPHYQDIHQLVETSERATKLTSRLLAFAQGKSFVVPELDVNYLVSEVAGILSRTLDRKIIFQAELEPNLYAIRADAGLVQQAVLHVALNSRDAMPNGGKLLFQTRNVTIGENDPRLRSNAKPGKHIQINISDTGGGMSNKIKEKIFNPKFTTKQEEPGKGLGLAIVQDVVEKHGGFISVFSETGRGTIFKIYLPATDTLVKQKKEDRFDKPVLGKETILLVDDEKVLRDTARRMLTRYGYKVISADSGTEAVAIYKKYLKRVDLIILDLIMPGVDINKIIKWLLKLNPHIKIIATMGLGEKETLESNVRDELIEVIQKPFQVRPLLKSIQSSLNS